MFNLKERSVVITGAAGNLGVATAQVFLQAEASMALLDLSTEHLGEQIPSLLSSPQHIMVEALDLLDLLAVEQAINAAQTRFGRLDVLVNTVGGYRGGTPFHKTSDDEWDFLLGLNLRTVRNACRAVIPHMLAQGSGRIVNVAARAGVSGGKNMAAYSAAKSGVIRLTESLSAELKDAGINVNCVLPSTIDTPQNRQAMPKADFSRWVQPAAIADVILFLASDAARAVHGAAIPV
jgi:NAD(P)-dependent dehydrogenase (short-subunit alcohol dehydrogenase family)